MFDDSPRILPSQVTWSVSCKSKLNLLFSKAFRLPNPCKSIVSHSSGIIFIFCCLEFAEKKSNFSTFLSPSNRRAIFCTDLSKAQLFRQRSFPQETKNDMTFSENFLSERDATKKYFKANSFYAHPNNCIKLRNEF